MVIIGIDAHKYTHTVVAVDAQGRQLASKTVGTTTADHLALLSWARRHGDELLWAVEDCRQLSRRLERDLLAAGQRIVRVPPKLMTNMRDAARSFGKSDPIDALAVARAALREPDLPVAQLDGPEREVRLLVDHREDLVAERTRIISRLRWHLHELDPGWQPSARGLDRPRALNQTAVRLEGQPGIVARLARELVERLRLLNAEINALADEITALVEKLAPSLVAICGCGPLTAAKILGETAGVRRFRSNDAYARHNGTAPLPVWSSNRARHRLSRRGNRQLNAALHRIALTQAHYHPGARALIARRRANGDGGLEAIRVLKRRLSDVVYQALLTDAHAIAQSMTRQRSYGQSHPLPSRTRSTGCMRSAPATVLSVRRGDRLDQRSRRPSGPAGDQLGGHPPGTFDRGGCLPPFCCRKHHSVRASYGLSGLLPNDWPP